MIRNLALLLAIAFAASASGQVSIGNRAGLSLSHMESDDSDIQEALDKDKNSLLGVSAALMVEVQVMEMLAFQTELGLTQKGHQNNEPKQDGYHRLRTNYGEGLLLAKGIFGKGPSKLNVLAGASFGRGLVGVDRRATIVFDTTANINFLDQESDLVDFGPDEQELNRVEWSLVGGLGASFDLGERSRLFIEGRYVNGLTSIYNEPKNGAPEINVFNRNILIQVGYFVRLDEEKKEAAAPPAGPQY